MSEDGPISDQSKCGIRIQVDPPTGNVHRSSDYPSFTSFPSESVRNNDQESVIQHEVYLIKCNTFNYKVRIEIYLFIDIKSY
jgi:hypothetical protein